MSESPPRLEGRLGLLLDAAVKTLPDAVGAGLIAFPRGRVIGSRGEMIAGLDEAQLRLGQSLPRCAMERNVPVCSADLWADPRWPGLRPKLTGLPVPLAAIAVPGVASLEDDLLLTAYGSGLTEEQIRIATQELVRLVDADARRLVRDVGGILAGRRHIEQAKGLVMAARRCGAQEAFEVLRQASQHHQIKVRDLAVALLEAAGSQPVESGHTPSHRAREIAGEFARRYLR